MTTRISGNPAARRPDRKSRRLNSSHGYISDVGPCLKKNGHTRDNVQSSSECLVPVTVACHDNAATHYAAAIATLVPVSSPFSFMLLRPPSSTLFPYTTLFRSTPIAAGRELIAKRLQFRAG